jgi:hypothetical protein
MKPEDSWFQQTYPDLTKTMAYFVRVWLARGPPVAGAWRAQATIPREPRAWDAHRGGWFCLQPAISRHHEDGWQETRNLMLNPRNADHSPLTSEGKPARIRSIAGAQSVGQVVDGQRGRVRSTC